MRNFQETMFALLLCLSDPQLPRHLILEEEWREREGGREERRRYVVLFGRFGFFSVCIFQCFV